MENYIKVSDQKLKQDRKDLSQALKEIENSMEELRQAMQTLNDSWEGAARLAFQNQVHSDLETMKLVCRKLSAFLAHMEYAEQEYRSCEAEIGRIVQGIRI